MSVISSPDLTGMCFMPVTDVKWPGRQPSLPGRRVPPALLPDHLGWLSRARAGAEFPGNHESSQPGLFWDERLPGSGELQSRDRGGRELEPNPLERIRIASPGAGERQRQFLHGRVVPNDQQGLTL